MNGGTNHALVFTWKNQGACYLAMSRGTEAAKCFLDCIDLLNSMPIDEDQDLKIAQDREEQSNLYQNLYLTYIAESNFEKALGYMMKSIDMYHEAKNPNLQKLATKYYQKGNSLLYLGRRSESVEAIQKAIELLPKDEEMKISSAAD